jgi:hypothetical protein
MKSEALQRAPRVRALRKGSRLSDIAFGTSRRASVMRRVVGARDREDRL